MAPKDATSLSSTGHIILSQFKILPKCKTMWSVPPHSEAPSEQMLCTPCPGSPHAHRHIVHISLIPSIIGKHVTHVLHKHMRLRTVSCPITHQRGFLEPSISSGEMSVMEAHVPPPSVSNHLMLSPIIRLIWRPSAWLIRTFLSCPYFWNVWISAAC